MIERFRVGADVYIANEVCTPTLADKLFLSNPAAYWYRQAYENGDGTGAFNLAIDKRDEGNFRAAVSWFKKAIAVNYCEACIDRVRPPGL